MERPEYGDPSTWNQKVDEYLDTAFLADELEPGPLKDELLKDFDPSQESYEEYLQRKSLDRPFNAAEGGRVFYGGKEASLKGAEISANKRSADYIIDNKQAQEIRKILNDRKIPGVATSLQKNKKGTYSLRLRPARQIKDASIINDLIQKFSIRQSYSPLELDELLNNIEKIKQTPEYKKLDIIRGGTKINPDLVKLDKNKNIQGIFKRGNIGLNDLKTVQKILNVDQTTAANRLSQLSEIYTGNVPNKFISAKPKFAASANQAIENLNAEVLRKIYDRKVSNLFGEKLNLKKTREKIQKAFPESARGIYDIDEIAGVTSSVRKGSTPYAIFVQAIDRGLNRNLKQQFDSYKGTQEEVIKNIIKEGKDPTQEINKFNTKVKEYIGKLNKDVEGPRKIDLFKITTKSPDKAISDFNKLPRQYQKIFMDNYASQGYSFEVPKKTETIFNIAKEIDKNPRYLERFDKPGKPTRFFSTIPGVPQVSNLIESTIDDIRKAKVGSAALKSLGMLGVGYGIYDTGVAYQEGKSLPEMATRFFGLDSVYNSAKQYAALSPKAQEIQKKINYQKSFESSLEDPLDENLMGLAPKEKATEEEKQLLNFEKSELQNKQNMLDAERAQNRQGILNLLKGKIYNITGTPYETEL